jgi:hypothetical protein
VQEARRAAADGFYRGDDLSKFAAWPSGSKLGFSDRWRWWRWGFDQHGAGCGSKADFERLPERLSGLAEGWCQAALVAPWGHRNEVTAHAAAPLGDWCAFPQTGHFHEV